MPSTTVTKKFGKKGQDRKVERPRPSKFYPADDLPRKRVTRAVLASKVTTKPKSANKLRKSITPGTVLIVLAGRFRGKRVVFLKQLPSGLLLVTGPFKINGVPLRRVNQAYVIATSTRVDISGVTIPESVNDAAFKKEAAAPKAKTADSFFVSDDKTPNVISEARKADQKAVDSGVIAAVKKVPQLKDYLSATFTLERHQFPHELKF
jgi:large subunit ribosomal protein L6e